jgi:molybdenum cofactor cytidylyltransferase
MNFPQLSILIPAAGASTRLGQTKQLVNYKGKSLIQNTVNTAAALNPKEIIVVTGANEIAVKYAGQHSLVRYIQNPQWHQGMGRSIAVGTSALNPKSKGVLILLCDQWRVQAQDLEVLADRWQSNEEQIVCANAEGINMPPVIFPLSCFDLLKNMDGDQGARCLLAARPELLNSVLIKNAVFDLDTTAQLDELRKLD